jgi:hypothetical protein
LAREVSRTLGKTTGKGVKSMIAANLTHGYAKKGAVSSTYHSWHSMLYRCANPKRFPHYIGVRVCERWLTFENFLADMGERPEGTSIGRILDMGDYEPGNAFWQIDAEQKLAQRNKRALLTFAAAA